MLATPPSSTEESLAGTSSYAEAGPDGDLRPSHGCVVMAKSWETFHISVSLTCQNVSVVTLGLASLWRGGRALENEAINAGRDLWTCGCDVLSSSW